MEHFKLIKKDFPCHLDKMHLGKTHLGKIHLGKIQ
jgi:hypothetical protein